MMYKGYETPEELNYLKFSIWDKMNQFGHALFSGDLMETSYYLENNSMDNLEVSALDIQCMESHEPVTAEQWLDWYYMVALSILEEIDFKGLFRYPVSVITADADLSDYIH